MKPWRPTDKEINGKLAAARLAVARKQYSFLSLHKVYAHLAELDLYSEEEIHCGLKVALTEICSKHYAGSQPPQKSYESEIKGKELFAFSWDSDHFVRRVYFKFVDLSNEKGPGISIVSLHVDKPSGPKRRS